ncbi:hypothetical protein BLNAU_14120 [Blattamonas nauphoetae]|uniref:Uncharacterized protein n=1 Tax=Blattamonas nauphoetae TaxID=2049346 RepID=A0ABQ9XHL4_9EUKA|nr:hypothetical protein BLNAU_14120 [Blattamonas nauphoetae]
MNPHPSTAKSSRLTRTSPSSTIASISLSLPLLPSLYSSLSLPRPPNPNPRHLLLSLRSESDSLPTNPVVVLLSLQLPFHTPPFFSTPPEYDKLTTLPPPDAVHWNWAIHSLLQL